MKINVIKSLLILVLFFFIFCWFYFYKYCMNMHVSESTDNSYSFTEELFPTAGKGAYRYRLFSGTGSPVNFEIFLHELANDNSSMRNILYEAFHRRIDDQVSNNQIAFFWECPPINIQTVSSTQFEFVLIPTTAFSDTHADCSAFEEHISLNCNNVNRNIMIFKSLNKDATLISPCPATGTGVTTEVGYGYTHFYSMVDRIILKYFLVLLGNNFYQFYKKNKKHMICQIHGCQLVG